MNKNKKTGIDTNTNKMSNRSLKGNELHAKAIIIKCFFLWSFIFFLFPVLLNAQEISINVGGTTRQMIIYAPAGIEQSRPLVISMHGMSQTMNDQKNQTQFESVARDSNFVLVFPNAIDKQWQLWGTTDTDFILAIIDEMYKRYKIDRDRVYLSGFSMGGMMTYYAATKIADKIAAFAPVTGFLMGGPDTNSSRPIPIIHVHGDQDNYVPYTRVQECLDAWIKRNGCPVTPVMTKPYPADKPTSQSFKKYWGPGKEGVEIVFISVSGVGHWYSDDPNAIFTSREIWNFCKKFSLKDGVPEFKYASVTDNNPKQILLSLSKSVVDSNHFKGFTIKVDNQSVIIDSVVVADTNRLVINLKDSIQANNVVTLSYSNGNVVSVYGKKLPDLSDTLVDNLLKGSSPRLIEIKTNEGGDTLFAKFNKKMIIPSDISSLALNAVYNGQANIPILKALFFNNDSTIIAFPLGKKVYRDYQLLLSYSGNNVVSSDNGLLKTITNFQVTNNSNGLPVHFNSGKIETDGITLSLQFSKSMMLQQTQSGNFSFKVNGKSVTFKSYSVIGSTIQFVLSNSVHFGDTATISYAPGNVKAADNGPLEAFGDSTVTSMVTAPAWISVPGKIEAENYTFKSGMQAETTTDTGGGQNLGYIGNGDWAEYAIENKTTNTGFQINFRLAAQSSGGIIDFYVDGVYVDRVATPNTGNWQVYQTVSKNITVSQGKHYLKIVATSAGFNINYMDLQSVTTAIGDVDTTGSEITIYPNPVSNEMIIRSGNFRHNKIEVFDVAGNIVISRATAGEKVLHVPINLSSGLYCVGISNDKRYQFKKIVIANQ